MKGKLARALMPVFNVEGKPYALLTPQLAGISKKQLGAAALDLLITGI